MLLTKEKLFFNYWTPYQNQSKIYIYVVLNTTTLVRESFNQKRF